MFSPLKFVFCIKEFHRRTAWRYSGETDLLLLDIVASNENSNASFDFDNVICCNLDKLIRVGAIDSIHSFFEKIVNFVESERRELPTTTFSDLMGYQKGKDGLITFIKDMSPGEVGKDIESILQFRTRSIKTVA